MNKKYLFYIVGVAITVLLIGVFFSYRKTNKSITMNNKLEVTTSFYPNHFLARQIGGDLVEVINLTPAGSEPHDYELTSSDVINIKKSKILILNGGGLEVWEDDIRKNLNKDVLVLTLGEDLINQKLEEGDAGKKDPHIWLSPALMIKMAEKVTAGLSQVDFENKSYYESNLTVLKFKLINLDAQYKKELDNCKKRNFVTAHDAFTYLAKEYNLNQVAIAGISPEEEPSIKQLVEVSKFAKDNEIKYIFFEKLVSPKLAQTVAQEIGAQTLVLNPLEGLSADDLAQGKNYLTEMEKNLENLKIALECN